MHHPTGMHVSDHHAQHGGPVVILVHGSLARGTTFSRVIRRMGDVHVVSYDRRGYGRSRHMESIGILADHVADLLVLVDDGPAVVVGHSFGGTVALGAAIAAPGRVVGLGAYEPPLPWLEWWPRRARSQAEEDPARFAESFFRRMVGDDAWEHASSTLRAELEADGPALMAELTALRAGGAPFDVTELAVPAVFGRGERSRDHHRRAAWELASAVHGSQLYEISGAAHGAHLTHPAAFADFVRRAVPGAGDDAGLAAAGHADRARNQDQPDG